MLVWRLSPSLLTGFLMLMILGLFMTLRGAGMVFFLLLWGLLRKWLIFMLVFFFFFSSLFSFFFLLLPPFLFSNPFPSSQQLRLYPSLYPFRDVIVYKFMQKTLEVSDWYDHTIPQYSDILKRAKVSHTLYLSLSPFSFFPPPSLLISPTSLSQPPPPPPPFLLHRISVSLNTLLALMMKNLLFKKLLPLKG